MNFPLCVVVISITCSQKTVNGDDDEEEPGEPAAQQFVQRQRRQLERAEPAPQRPLPEQARLDLAKRRNACRACVDQVRYMEVEVESIQLGLQEALGSAYLLAPSASAYLSVPSASAYLLVPSALQVGALE